MPLILNIETATTVCSVALGRDGLLLSSKELNGDYTHAENLTLFIEDVLKEASLELSALDAVAVSKGPGSYTGLRIGVSAAKGLCYALDKPLLAINTLEHMASSVSPAYENTGEDVYFCPMIDARRMEVYCAVFDKQNQPVRSTEAVIIDARSFEDLFGSGRKLIFFGDGAEKCREIFAGNSSAVFLEGIFPSAKSMITLSEAAFNRKAFEDLAYFEPFYLKDFVAGKKKSNV